MALQICRLIIITILHIIRRFRLNIVNLFVIHIGMSQVVGSTHRIGFKASADGVVVERLKTAGCIPLLVSNNPEYCYSWETNNLINGVCRNPYDSRRTPGGSSGGEVCYLIENI